MKPDRLIAFVYDRICRNCHIRYVLPTPLWAAILFILVGLLLIAGAGLDAVLHSRDGEGFLMIWKLLFAGLGVISLIYGIKSLAHRRIAN